MGVKRERAVVVRLWRLWSQVITVNAIKSVLFLARDTTLAGYTGSPAR